MSLSRNDLKKLARKKLEEVKLLYTNKFYDAAYYASGYVIEFALKARICKNLNIDTFPDGKISKLFKTHNLKDLFFLSGLQKKFDKAKLNNTFLFANWSIIENWSENFRYNPIGTNERQNIKEIIDALDDSNNGVFTWIKRNW